MLMWSWVKWFLLWTAAWTAAASCQREDSSCLEEVEAEVLFLQVQQNVTRMIETSGRQATILADQVKHMHNVLQNTSWSELLQTAQTVKMGTQSFGTFLLDVLLVVVIVILLFACGVWSCCRGMFASLLSSSAPKEEDGRGSSGRAERSRQEPSFSQSQVAEIPKICQRYVVPSSESHFSVDMNEVMDTGRSSFAINSASGTKLLEAKLSEGRLLSIILVNTKDPEIMLRASSGAADPLMLTITDGRGSYQGKIAAGPAGSRLILYRLQKPCATITADNVSSLSMQVYPLLDSVKDTMVASTIRKGDTLRIQVSMNYDGCLFLGCMLGIIVLEPPLIQMAAG